MSVPFDRRRYVLYPRTRRQRAQLRSAVVARSLSKYARVELRTHLDVAIAGFLVLGMSVYGVVLVIWGLATK